MPTVSASFNRPADTVPYAAGDLICNAGAPVALEFTPPQVGSGLTATWPKFQSARFVRANGAAPAAIRAVFLTRRHVRNVDPFGLVERADNLPKAVEWPAYTGADNAPFPAVPFSMMLDIPRVIPAPRIILPDHFDYSVQNQLPFTPIRVLLMALEPFVPLSGETFTLELSTDRTA